MPAVGIMLINGDQAALFCVQRPVLGRDVDRKGGHRVSAVAFSGTGKTTIAHALAGRVGAVYLRIDTIEQAIRNSGAVAEEVGRSGYLVANQLALSNLQLGSTVIVDCVNPVIESRQAWSEISSRAGVVLLNIQVVCSDKAEHQRRVETRQGDIPGLTPPTWQSVLTHEYDGWENAPFTVDTARTSAASAVAIIAERLLATEPGRL